MVYVFEYICMVYPSIYHTYTIHIPYICSRSTYVWYIPYIYHTYTKNRGYRCNSAVHNLIPEQFIKNYWLVAHLKAVLLMYHHRLPSPLFFFESQVAPGKSEMRCSFGCFVCPIARVLKITIWPVPPVERNFLKISSRALFCK